MANSAPRLTPAERAALDLAVHHNCGTLHNPRKAVVDALVRAGYVRVWTFEGKDDDVRATGAGVDLSMGR